MFITFFFLAEMTFYVHYYYNHNTNKQTAGYNYSKPQVVSSAWLFWWQDSNFFLQLHFLLPLGSVELRYFLLRKHVTCLLNQWLHCSISQDWRRVCNQSSWLTWAEMLKWQMLHFYHYADMVGTNLIGGIKELYSYIFIYPYTWVP